MTMICYNIVLFLIKLYRKIELFLLKLFPSTVEKYVKYHFQRSGIEFNGTKPWDIQVNDKKIYARIVNEGPLGLGEGYMDGEWESEDIASMTFQLFNGEAKAVVNWFHPWNRFLNYMQCSHFNLQCKSRAKEVGEKHYDLGNDLFESFLDPSMNYSCGYWKDATNLDDAQYAKMELIAAKLNLKPGMKVLDIGCGWGGMAAHLATNYGVSVVGITISAEQTSYARKRCANLPVEIRLVDYRELNEEFDRILSVGMFEHVGKNNHRCYFKTVHRCLKENGIFLLHTMSLSDYSMMNNDYFEIDWKCFFKLTTYIFANGYIPYGHIEIMNGIDKLFVIEDLQNFGNDYSRTSQAWLDNFNKNWPTLKTKYGPRFYRMWTYYLQFGIGGFKARKVHLWQLVLTKDGIKGGYYAGR